MYDFYKNDDDGICTVAELIAWLESNCDGSEHCSDIGGGNISITFADNGKRIVFE